MILCRLSLKTSEQTSHSKWNPTSRYLCTQTYQPTPLIELYIVNGWLAISMGNTTSPTPSRSINSNSSSDKSPRRRRSCRTWKCPLIIHPSSRTKSSLRSRATTASPKRSSTEIKITLVEKELRGSWSRWKTTTAKS